jgi:TolA-binding protein
MTLCAQDATQSDQDAQEVLLAKANHLFDEGDFAKAMIYYNQIIARYPDSTASVTAQAGIDQLMQSLGTIFIPNLSSQRITDGLKTAPTYQTVERAIRFLRLYPEKSQFTSIQQLLGSVFDSVSMRYKVSRIENPDAQIVYNGTDLDGGAIVHRFSYDGADYNLQTGDRILCYQITDYDPLRGVGLTSLENLPYRLKEKHSENEYHYFSAQLVYFPLKKICTAHIFFDSLLTRRGYQLSGIIDESMQGRVTLTAPAGETVRQIAFEDDAVAQKQYRYVADTQTILETSYENAVADAGSDRNLAKLRYFVEEKQWLEAVGFYLWLLKQSLIDRDTPEYSKLYIQIESHVAGTTLAERLLEYALTCIERGRLLTAVSELSAIINAYPADTASMKAHNALVHLARLPEFILGVGSVASSEFPLTFMGFNVLGDSKYMNQINYKKRSYFLGVNESIGGFRVTGNETRTISYFDRTLNVTKDQNAHYLTVIAEQAKTIWLKEGDSHADPGRWYIEITDKTTGKTYPAYINKDTIITTDAKRYYGMIILSDRQQEVSVYADLTADSEPAVIKKHNIQSLHIENYTDDSLFEKVFSVIGPVAISEIHNYYTAQEVSGDLISDRTDSRKPEPDNDQPLADSAPADQSSDQAFEKKPDAIKEQTNSASEKTSAEKKPAPVKKDQIKSTDPQKVRDDELVIRHKKLLLKKRIIKLLGSAIILWLLYMAYKLIKSFR